MLLVSWDVKVNNPWHQCRTLFKFYLISCNLQPKTGQHSCKRRQWVPRRSFTSLQNEALTHRMVWKGPLMNTLLQPPCCGHGHLPMDQMELKAPSSLILSTSQCNLLHTAQATDLLLPPAVLLLQDLRMNRKTTAPQKPTTNRDSL